MAADDVSADAEMMLFAIAHNDEIFAPMSRRTHHQRSGIMREAHIICPTGQTSLKKTLAFASAIFMAAEEGFFRALPRSLASLRSLPRFGESNTPVLLSSGASRLPLAVPEKRCGNATAFCPSVFRPRRLLALPSSAPRRSGSSPRGSNPSSL